MPQDAPEAQGSQGAAPTTYIASVRRARPRFQIGINFPWCNYGYDFGDPPFGWSKADRAKVEEAISKLHQLGIFALRWFVFGDGTNYGVGSDAPYPDATRFEPPVLTQSFLDDFEWLLKTLKRYDMKLVPSLIDFHWCYPGEPKNFGQSVSLELDVTGLPPGATHRIIPKGVVPIGTSTLTVKTTSQTPTRNATGRPAESTLTIVGKAGALTHTTTVVLKVSSASPSPSSPDFIVSVSPGIVTVSPSQPTTRRPTLIVTVAPIGKFSDAVSLSVTGLPPGATANFFPSRVFPPGTSTLTVKTTSQTPTRNATGRPAESTLTIVGKAGALTHTTTVVLKVSSASPSPPPQDFTVSAFPAPPASVAVRPGESAKYTITVASLGEIEVVKGGRSCIITNATLRGRFFERVLKPLLNKSNKYKDTIYAWELINEPEGATKGSNEGDARKNALIGINDMVGFIEEGIGIINSSPPDTFESTVGYRRSITLEGWKGRHPFLGVTLPQFHYYPLRGLEPPSDEEQKRLNLSPGVPQGELRDHKSLFLKPYDVFVGEFATKLTKEPWPDFWRYRKLQRVYRRLKLIAKKKYVSAFPWGYNFGGRSDEYTDWPEAEKGIKEYLSK